MLKEPVVTPVTLCPGRRRQKRVSTEVRDEVLKEPVVILLVLSLSRQTYIDMRCPKTLWSSRLPPVHTAGDKEVTGFWIDEMHRTLWLTEMGDEVLK